MRTLLVLMAVAAFPAAAQNPKPELTDKQREMVDASIRHLTAYADAVAAFGAALDDPCAEALKKAQGVLDGARSPLGELQAKRNAVLVGATPADERAARPEFVRRMKDVDVGGQKQQSRIKDFKVRCGSEAKTLEKLFQIFGKLVD
jgi:hypothetical protein